jgi:hypothetical protein
MPGYISCANVVGMVVQVKFLPRKSVVKASPNLEMHRYNIEEIGLHFQHFYGNVAPNAILSESSFITGAMSGRWGK